MKSLEIRIFLFIIVRSYLNLLEEVLLKVKYINL